MLINLPISRSILSCLDSHFLYFPGCEDLRPSGRLELPLLRGRFGILCAYFLLAISSYLNKPVGSLKWFSKLYRNQGSLILRPKPVDWSEQIVVVTGGASGIGELLANTLAVRNVTVVVLDVNPIVTENCALFNLTSRN